MTPRTMENSLNQVFSELIMLQKNEKMDPFDLSESAPIMKPLHPKMVKALLQFMDNPEHEASTPVVPGKFFACYPSVEKAQIDFPALQVVKGFPFEVYQHSGETILFDFSPFGAVIISDSALDKKGIAGIHQHILPPFLEYALSPELWGNQGKWIRFHERLNTQFDKYKLLNGKSSPGRYPLIAEASKLEKRGIKGNLNNSSFVLTFPWTFPLSALEKLEDILQEEF